MTTSERSGLSPEAQAVVDDRDPGSGLTKFERFLFDENKRLREALDEVRLRPLPYDNDDPGYVTWRALMEDAHDRGEVRFEVREVATVEITWEAA